MLIQCNPISACKESERTNKRVVETKSQNVSQRTLPKPQAKWTVEQKVGESVRKKPRTKAAITPWKPSWMAM
jgi:hypothetical protein